MAQQTEAACLLETGALYQTRVLLEREAHPPIFAGLKQGTFSLYFGDEPIVHFDLEGRWQRAYIQGIHYLKGLDANVQAIDRVREGTSLVLERTTLDSRETAALDAQIRELARSVLDVLESNLTSRVDPPANVQSFTASELRAHLDRVTGWDEAAWDAHRRAYAATYGPMPFIPPDCRNAVVLQATIGSAGASAFGRNGSAATISRSESEFEAHARQVAALLGRRVDQCRWIFIGGSDFPRRPIREVTAILEAANRVFAIKPRDPESTLGGFHLFLDVPDAPGLSVDGCLQMAELGVRRLSLGVESGSPQVRSRFDRHWHDDALVSVVANAKQAGLGVGLVVLGDAGSLEDAERHVAETVALVGRLALGSGDLISLLDSEDSGDQAGSPVTDRQAQLERLRNELAPIRVARGFKVVHYNPDKQSG